MFSLSGPMVLPCIHSNHVLQALLLYPIVAGAAVSSFGKSRRNKHRELDALKKISSMINRSLDINVILAATLDEVMGSLGMEAGAFRILVPNTSPHVAIYRGFSKETTAVLDKAHEGSANFAQQITRAKPLILSTSSKGRDPALADAWTLEPKRKG